jgi:hypothetical protein
MNLRVGVVNEILGGVMERVVRLHRTLFLMRIKFHIPALCWWPQWAGGTPQIR